MSEINRSGPTIPEMKEMVARGSASDFYPSKPKIACVDCGTEKPIYWVVHNGVRSCNKCSEKEAG